MNIQKTDLDGVLLITPPVMHEDFRGTNTETYHYDEYRKAGIKTNFILVAPITCPATFKLYDNLL